MNVLVEKPLVATIKEWEFVQNKLLNYKGIGMTAFNMRYHPCVQETKLILELVFLLDNTYLIGDQILIIQNPILQILKWVEECFLI